MTFLTGAFLGILIGLAIPPIYKWTVATFFTPKQNALILGRAATQGFTRSDIPEIKEGIRNTLVVLAIFAGVAWIGSTSPLWLLLYCPVTLAGFAYWAGNGNMFWVYRLAILGLLAAALWNIFGI